MEVTNAPQESVYDRKSELKAFDDSKSGVKGLVDAGVARIPRIFINHQHKLNSTTDADSKFSVPIIDLQGLNSSDAFLRSEITDKIFDASQNWGFFQIVNHGIPTSVLDEIIDGIRGFHEQDTQVKKELYTRDAFQNKVMYTSNFDLYQAPFANWRDTFASFMAPHPPNPESLPAVCRDIVIEYSKQVMKLVLTLFELLSEALGLNLNHLKDMRCAEGLLLLGHYYPACPEPDLTMGTSIHADSDFLTVLLQDQLGGLQIHHEEQWIDIPPMHGALLVNIGDFLQLISNEKFKSVNHRVLANHIGPRISVACFIRPIPQAGNTRLYGPIEELLSEENPPVYKETSVKDYLALYYSKDEGPARIFAASTIRRCAGKMGDQ